MKLNFPISPGWSPRRWAALLTACAAVSSVIAGEEDTNAPAKPTPPLTALQQFEGGTTSYNNWVDVSTGGFLNRGNPGPLRQRIQSSGGLFGGIDDFHYKKDIAKNTTLALDGRAMFDNRDYKFSLDLEREKLGFFKFSYNEFRTWYNGDGGYYPPGGLFYPFSPDALALDRGQFSVEGGLALDKKNIPNITFKYTHDFRHGDKSSTAWGMTHPALGVSQGLSPSFDDINERRDAFQLDLTHHIKATEFGAGIRYETGKLNDALKITQFPGEAVQQRITDRQNTSFDLLNVHGFSETWLKKNLMFSLGGSYSDISDNLTGSRTYGSDFDMGYVPGAAVGAGYFGLNGATRTHEYVGDANLFYKPTAHLTIVPSVRIDREISDASAAGFQTLGVNAPVPFSSSTAEGILDGRERLDINYNGITNWTFYGRGEWTEGSGNLSESGGLGPVGGIGLPPVQLQRDNSRFFQKYSAGARWYPRRNLTLDAGGYYKLNHYGYTDSIDSSTNNSADRYPGYLLMQDFETIDGNFRVTYRPWSTVTSVTRYEYQWSTIHTGPDAVSGLAAVDTSKMTSHIIAEDISWTPWSRLFLQAGVNYVLSKTHTPASDATQAILDSQNNYWTLNLSSGFVVDDKTDLNLNWYYYRADDYHDNSALGVPYGAGAKETGVTATLARRLTKNLRGTVKYGYFHGANDAFAANANYSSQLIYTSLQYRF